MNHPNVPAAVSWPSHDFDKLTDAETEHLRRLLLERFGGEVCFDGEGLTSATVGTLGDVIGRSLILRPWIMWEFADEDAGLDHLNHPLMTDVVDRVDNAFRALGFDNEEEVLDRDPAVVLLRCEKTVGGLEEVVELLAAALPLGFLHFVGGPSALEAVE